MALRRCLHSTTRHSPSLIKPTNQSSSYHSLQKLHSLSTTISTRTLTFISKPIPSNPILPFYLNTHFPSRHFSSNSHDNSDTEDDSDEYDDGDDVECFDDGNGNATSDLNKEYTDEEKELEAAQIGYKVVGPVLPSDRVFKPYEPVYAVVQIGSHQFKVSNGDCIFTERLKFCDVNDKLILNKVLLLGSATQTMIGRPIVPDSSVHAVVEEHALDAKVIIFKKKRRKNYRRTKGHRQELTKLRITDIQGIAKPETKDKQKPKKVSVEKPEEKVPVAA